MTEIDSFAALIAELRADGAAASEVLAASAGPFRRLLGSALLESVADEASGRSRALLHRSEAVTLFVMSSAPGTATDVHDHGTWGLVGQLTGEEVEHVYRMSEDGPGVALTLDSSRALHPGEVSTILPPTRDIHQVVNVGEGTSVTLHAFAHDVLERGFTIFEPGPFAPWRYCGHWDSDT
jgi:predicted metal-dependent enzyme (double-stranded beta helix superfamily)